MLTKSDLAALLLLLFSISGGLAAVVFQLTTESSKSTPPSRFKIIENSELRVPNASYTYGIYILEDTLTGDLYLTSGNSACPIVKISSGKEK